MKTRHFRNAALWVISIIAAIATFHAVRSQEMPVMVFAAMADIQYADRDPYITPYGDRFPRQSKWKLMEAAGRVNLEGVDFTVQLGDLVDSRPKSLMQIQPVLGLFEAPMINVVGNHDDDTFGRKHYVEALAMPGAYYTFTRTGWRFIVLDSTEGDRHRRTVGDEQVQWLKGVLAGSSRPIIVFSHHPLFSLSPDHNVRNNLQLHKLFVESGVVAHMSGHFHVGGYTVQDGIHYLTLHGMAETKRNNSFAIISLYADRIDVDGYGLEPDRTLRIK